MTIIVLEFEVPDPLTVETLLGMWRDVLAYAISFFWLGCMWVNQHNFWHLFSRWSRSVASCCPNSYVDSVPCYPFRA